MTDEELRMQALMFANSAGIAMEEVVDFCLAYLAFIEQRPDKGD